jgi:hypothetical protein
MYYTVNLPIQFPSAFVTLKLTAGYGAAVVDKHSLSVHGAIMNNAQFGYGVSDPAGCDYSRMRVLGGNRLVIMEQTTNETTYWYSPSANVFFLSH